MEAREGWRHPIGHCTHGGIACAYCCVSSLDCSQRGAGLPLRCVQVLSLWVTVGGVHGTSPGYSMPQESQQILRNLWVLQKVSPPQPHAPGAAGRGTEQTGEVLTAHHPEHLIKLSM